MRLKVCAVPVLPLRSKPSHSEEMVSQILYGESVEVIEHNDEWVKVRLEYDGYEGWAVSKFFTDADTVNKGNTIILKELWNKICVNNRYLWLSAGAEIDKNFVEAEEPDTPTANVIDIISTAKMFLGIPYLWGGKSSFGIDCSGFAQTVFKINNIKLPRDASQQINLGEIVCFVEAAEAGDLAFFGKSSTSITHVGILLDSKSIIHASGIVRIDKIDNTGIFNIDKKEYTHNLLSVKRIC